MSKKGSKKKRTAGPTGAKKPRMGRDETVDVVNTIGDILNIMSLAIINDADEQALRNLAIRKGNEAAHPTVKNICFNIATAPDIERSINVLRARLGDALN